MQQTENYKLNLIKMSDAFSLLPLNGNAEKLDAALTLFDTAVHNLAYAAAHEELRYTVENHRRRILRNILCEPFFSGTEVAFTLSGVSLTDDALVLDSSAATGTATRIYSIDVKSYSRVWLWLFRLGGSNSSISVKVNGQPMELVGYDTLITSPSGKDSTRMEFAAELEGEGYPTIEVTMSRESGSTSPIRIFEMAAFVW